MRRQDQRRHLLSAGLVSQALMTVHTEPLSRGRLLVHLVHVPIDRPVPPQGVL